jgi:sugar lactone lactonase YvrE
MNHLATFAIACALPLVSGSLAAQNAPPVNDRPNTYGPAQSWRQLPQGRTLGAVSGVDIDRDGRSIWVADRCGGNSCADSTLAPILKLDAEGRVVKAFGAGLFAIPHGVHVDREGNVWVTDDSTTPAPGKGHQVIKFDPDGKILLTLGKAGMPGTGPETFNRPSDVVVAASGDIFVADGHGGDSNARIVKFSRDGRFLATWGMKGTGRGEFDTPHGVAMDSRGRLFVADLRNYRVQVFEQDGRFVDEWRAFGMPGGIFIDARDTLYVADSLSNPQTNPGWIRGIRIGSARDGGVTAFVPDATPDANPITAAEGVAVDAQGNIYGSVVPTPGVLRYVPR